MITDLSTAFDAFHLAPGVEADDASIAPSDLRSFLTNNGFLADDPRFKRIYTPAREAAPVSPSDSDSTAVPISPVLPQFNAALAEEVMDRAFAGKLAIPDLPSFMEEVKGIFEKVRDRATGGKVASYNLFAVSFCSIDGQRFHLGDATVPFSIQSCCKPVSYSIALEELGDVKVHSHIGPGAIMSTSLIQRGKPIYKRFGKIEETWNQLFGGKRISFNNGVYLSEKETADRNYALAYMMKEAGAFPEGTDLAETLELYFQCCSLEADTDRMSIMAATYASGGLCPITGTTLFTPDTVRNCISLMASCGMYDYSGEWNFRIGLPAKSGVSGALWVVIPNVGGFCCYSPCLDSIGNSKKGLEFFQLLSEKYAFHILEPVRLKGLKKDPTAGVGVVDPKIGVSLKRIASLNGQRGGRDGVGADVEEYLLRQRQQSPLSLPSSVKSSVAASAGVPMVRNLSSKKKLSISKWMQANYQVEKEEYI
ncbi:hypothetical protein HDU98_006171 [Podochytrium sp. JEL0797]|nr:hypothetical protein HDU98_006171 [Podochytrium sp. JEL0797]